jgi:hypothetical protein
MRSVMMRQQKVGWWHLVPVAVLLLLTVVRAAPPWPLVDVLVFGADLNLDLNAYPPELRGLIQEHKRRFEAYVPKRPKLTSRGEMFMGYESLTRYERRLVAISPTAGVDAIAQQYVTELAPCLEWEGFHDCPEREARFAAQYQAAHPDGPFSQYLPLLEAHRWLCAAEGYSSEQSPAESARARRSYEQALATARRSSSLLVRTAALELANRSRCNRD